MTVASSPEVHVLADLNALARAAAKRFVAEARASVERADRFTVALAGGGTPLPMYRLLGGKLRGGVPWERTELYFGDERCVPPTDPASNYGAAYDALLRHVSPAAAQRIRGEQDPESAARDYDDVLRAAFAADAANTFDVALLGVGADGHTVSIFPGSPALEERVRRAVAVPSPTTASPHVPRITVTLPVLERSREVWFLCAGADKRDVVGRILAGAAAELPAARVHGTLRTLWLLDRAAAGE